MNGNKKRGEKLDIWDMATLVLADAIGTARGNTPEFRAMGIGTIS
jgi:hypothetical protein